MQGSEVDFEDSLSGESGLFSTFQVFSDDEDVDRLLNRSQPLSKGKSTRHRALGDITNREEAEAEVCNDIFEVKSVYHAIIESKAVV